jgi:aromatic ring-cleaving dioxygenase
MTTVDFDAMTNSPWWEFNHVGNGVMIHPVTGARCGWSHILDTARAHRQQLVAALSGNGGAS